MRIGIDVLAIQSPYSRGRGIGRYARHLLQSILDRDQSNEYFLYTYEDLPTDHIPTSTRTQFCPLARRPDQQEHTLQHVAERLVRENPDQLDWFVLLSPFETWAFYGLPAKPLNGLKLAAVVYDMIPFLFQEVYLSEPNVGNWFYGHLQRLKTFDLLLTISEATRNDVLKLLRYPEPRVVTIGTASDGAFFVPDPSEPIPSASLAVLNRLGIDRPFVFCLGSHDPRKNLVGLLNAFQFLPDKIRTRHELVIACALTGKEADDVLRHAEHRGLQDHVTLTGEVTDEELRILYQRCAAFAFPSLYEGFGLPLLEAMHCGAAVVAGNNSSQPEVVGDAGLLANVSDPTDIAAKLEELLTDPDLAHSLGSRAQSRANLFQWDVVARRTLDALATASTFPEIGRLPHGWRIDRVRYPRPRIALVSPLPPTRSGIADYASRLVQALRVEFRIDLYHDRGLVPELEFSGCGLTCYDHRLFDRNVAELGYQAVIYQMGNSSYHHFVYDLLLRHPGIVDLHDFCLAGFQLSYQRSEHAAPDHLNREIEHSHPGRGAEFQERSKRWVSESGGLQEAMARRGLLLNRRVLERASKVIVHSDWCREQAAQFLPDLVRKLVVIPLGAEPFETPLSDRATIRARYGIEPDSFVFASFGILHPIKLNVETIRAFKAVAQALPSVRLYFIGRDLGEGEAARVVRELGLVNQVRFLGHLPATEYEELIAAVDVGICLRRPPTNGESSAALLDLLRRGVPTIVSAVGTFNDLPHDAVVKVPWPSVPTGVQLLQAALFQCVLDPSLLTRLGQVALAYIAKCHAWPSVAQSYKEILLDSNIFQPGDSKPSQTGKAPQLREVKLVGVPSNRGG